MVNQIQMIPVGEIVPNPNNPRRNLGDVEDLAASIRSQGIRQNLLLTPVPGSSKLMLVIGHRRFAAAKLAGLSEVPAVVTELTEREQRELMLVENSQRSDLTVFEEADGFQGLLDLGVSVREIAERTGRSETSVRKRLRVAALPASVREKSPAQPTLSDLERLASIDDEKLQKDGADFLGTNSFDWYIRDAQRRLKRRRVLDKWLGELSANDMPVGDVPADKSFDYAPDGLRQVLLLTPNGEDDEKSAVNVFRDAGYKPAWQILIKRDDDGHPESLWLYKPVEGEKPSAEELHAREETRRRRLRARKEREFLETMRELHSDFLRKHLGTPLLKIAVAQAFTRLTLARILLGDSGHWKDRGTKATTLLQEITGIHSETTSLAHYLDDTKVWETTKAYYLLYAETTSMINEIDYQMPEKRDSLKKITHSLEALGYKPSETEKQALENGLDFLHKDTDE